MVIPISPSIEINKKHHHREKKNISKKIANIKKRNINGLKI